MFDQVAKTWTGINRHWLGRLFGAMLLPGWLLVIASAEQGPPSVTSVAAPVLSGIVVVGGLLGASLGLWAMTDRTQAEAGMQAWVGGQPEQTRLQKILSLIGGVIFLAGCYQVVFDFDVFSRIMQYQTGLDGPELSSWDTLLTLCAIQFVFFFAQSSAAKRNKTLLPDKPRK